MTAGTVIGWIVFCIVLVIVAAMLIVEMVKRHAEYEDTLNEQKRKMNELGIRLDKVDENF